MKKWTKQRHKWDQQRDYSYFNTNQILKPNSYFLNLQAEIWLTDFFRLLSS